MYPEVTKIYPEVKKLYPEIKTMYPEIKKIYPKIKKMYPKISWIERNEITQRTWCVSKVNWKATRPEKKCGNGMTKHICYRL